MNNFIKFFAGFLISGGLIALVTAVVYFLGGLLALMGNQSSLVDAVTILGILVSFVLPLIMFLRFRAGSPLLARGIGVGLAAAGVLEIWFWLVFYGVLPYVTLF